MSQGIDKIGSVTEKSFDKSSQFDLKNKEKEFNSSEDADAFSNLLKDDAALKQESETAIDGGEVAFKQAPSNAGDKILNAFQGMKDNIDTQHAKVDKLLNSDEIMSMKDMFKTQKAMTNLTMTQDLMGKVVGKSTQTLETMMKQQ